MPPERIYVSVLTLPQHACLHTAVQRQAGVAPHVLGNCISVMSIDRVCALLADGFFWYFYQDGGIEHEVKLTGILSTNGLSEGEGPYPDYGVLMAPHLNAQVRTQCFSMVLWQGSFSTALACCPCGGCLKSRHEPGVWSAWCQPWAML